MERGQLMSEAVSIDTLEMVLNEQAENDSSLRVDGEIILNGDLLKDFNDLQEQKRKAIGQAAGSMGGVDTSDLDAQIAEVQRKAEEFVVRLHFKSLSSDDYLRVVARHPKAKSAYDAEGADWQLFQIDLAESCYTGCLFRGQELSKTQMPLAKLRNHPAVGFGQMEDIYDDVLGLNRREPDRSFLSKR